MGTWLCVNVFKCVCGTYSKSDSWGPCSRISVSFSKSSLFNLKCVNLCTHSQSDRETDGRYFRAASYGVLTVFFFSCWKCTQFLSDSTQSKQLRGDSMYFQLTLHNQIFNYLKFYSFCWVIINCYLWVIKSNIFCGSQRLSYGLVLK